MIVTILLLIIIIIMIYLSCSFVVVVTLFTCFVYGLRVVVLCCLLSRLALLGAVLEHAVGAHVGFAHHDVEALLLALLAVARLGELEALGRGEHEHGDEGRDHLHF